MGEQASTFPSSTAIAVSKSTPSVSPSATAASALPPSAAGVDFLSAVFVHPVAVSSITSSRLRAACDRTAGNVAVVPTVGDRMNAAFPVPRRSRYSVIGSLTSWMKWFVLDDAIRSAAFFSAAFLSEYSNIASRFMPWL